MRNKFKIGDKVRITKARRNIAMAGSVFKTTSIGVVTLLGHNTCHVIFPEKKHTVTCYYSSIEKVNIPGQQLKFDFM